MSKCGKPTPYKALLLLSIIDIIEHIVRFQYPTCEIRFKHGLR